MARWVIVACAGVLVSGCSQVPLSAEETLIVEIERSVVLPKGAFPLESYDRYYARGELGKEIENGEIISGVYLRRSFDPGQARTTAHHLVDLSELPMFFDGGCDLVNVRYDTATKRVLAVFCNGEA